MRNPWSYIPITAPYVLPEDESIITPFNLGAKEEYQIKFNCLPEPFVGSNTAPVVLLGLNPGYDDGDPEAHADTKFREALFQNLNHQQSEYPFYFLDPRFKNPGTIWWEGKLKPVLKFIDRQALANQLQCVEYFPYHSRKYKQLNLLLPSQQYTFSLVRQAIARRAIIVLSRSVKRWLAAVPELIDYDFLCKLNSVQNIIISENNCGHFNQIMDRLKA